MHLMSCIRPNHDKMLNKSFYTHIWMIKKLLDQARVKSGSRSFFLYVIASCYQKMLIRMDYCTSETICNTLKNMSTFDFSEQVHNTRKNNVENDQTFLSTWLHYKPLLDLQTNAPNLTHRAETCLEFHQLLSKLLECLHEALKILDSSWGNVGIDGILVQLELIGQLGYLIKLMVKGTAIKKHMKVIEDFLPDWLAPPSQVVKQEANDSGHSNGDNDPDGDEEVELGGGDTEALHRPSPYSQGSWRVDEGSWHDSSSCRKCGGFHQCR